MATHKTVGKGGGFRIGVWDRVDLAFWLLIIPCFYLATAVAMRSGFDSRILTGPIRAALAGIGILGLVAIIYRGVRPSFAAIVFLAVSFAYLMRVVIDEFSGATESFQGGSSVIAQFLITTFIPAFYLYFRPFPSLNTLKNLWWGVFLVCLVLIYSYRGVSVDAEGLRARGVMEMLGIINPIVVGHLGALLMEISLYLILFVKGRFKVVYFLGFLGLSLVLISNSRGPVLALLIVISLIVFARFRQVMGNGVKMLGLVMILLVIGLGVFYSLSQRETVLIDRLSSDDDGGFGRIYLYTECVKAALRSPFFGESVFLEMPDGSASGSESFLLDPLLATGLLFGSAWLLLAVYAAWRSVIIFIANPSLWVIVFFLHGLVLFGLSAGLISAGWGYAAFFSVLRIISFRSESRAKEALL